MDETAAIVFTFAKNQMHALREKDVAQVRVTEEETDEILRLPDGRKSISLGIGIARELTRRKFIVLLRRLIARAKSHRIRRLALNFSDFVFPSVETRQEKIAELLGTEFLLANFEFIRYKTPPKEGWGFVKEIFIVGNVSAALVAGITRGVTIGKEINAARALINTPGGEMTPRVLAVEARRAAKGKGVKVKVLGRGEIQKLNMGGILGVSQGSKEEPKFIVFEYLHGKKGGKPIVLIGKGVTFDTGGLNLKPETSIYEMHMDMSGGAVAIYAVIASARLKFKRNVVALVPAVENMPSGASYRPGDLLRTMSGKTIEVLNTDAEGRIILADAHTYAERYAPALVVNIATLTGAAEVALGRRASALFTRDAKLERLFRDLGEESGDYLWPLPLWDEYESEIKGTFGDWANLGKKDAYGGAITAAMFVYQFAKKYPWVHLDIAPRMTSYEGDYLAKGATGEPLRLLINLIAHYET